MEALQTYQDNMLRSITDKFTRSLYKKINWDQRMIAIKGTRGSGKTTLMLQQIKFDSGQAEALYITADHTYFYNHSLLEIAEEWYKNGGRRLFIDEVHKYPFWSRELKNIYDGYPEMKVVFSASSALDIYRGEGDLSRRAITYELPGLSFREYLEFKKDIKVAEESLENIIQNHRKISGSVLDKLHPLPAFKSYLKSGYLPISAEGETEYPIKLAQIINAVVDTDLAYIEGYGPGTAVKVKKLLAVLSESVPFKPNIAALARKLDLSRDSVYNYLSQLRDARLLNFMSAEGKGTSLLQKPDKLYLENTNLAHILSYQPDVGNMRETFLLNQLTNAGLQTNYPKEGDFLVNGIHIEVGGKNKTAKQVENTEQYIIAADEIEMGFAQKIPLWLFGFLY